MKAIQIPGTLIIHLLSISHCCSLLNACNAAFIATTHSSTSFDLMNGCGKSLSPSLKNTFEHIKKYVATRTSSTGSVFHITKGSSLPSYIPMKASRDNCSGSNSITTMSMNQQEESFSSHLKSTFSGHHFQSIQNALSNTNAEENQNSELNLILGNEAGDADSIISSLSLSYVKKKQQLSFDNIDNKKGEEEAMSAHALSLPIVSIHREDMSLRRDVVLLLKMAGIHNYDELLYLNDPTFMSIAKKKNEDGLNESHKQKIEKTITLVDHNKIRSDLWHLEQYVKEIIDHHQDEGCHTESATIREIAFEHQKATVGSTCTLVTERLIDLHQQRQSNIDAGLGIALLGVILLDTMNMDSNAGKGTPRDEKAINFLMKNTNWNLLEEDVKDTIMTDDGNDKGLLQPNRAKLFNFLQNSKFDKTFWLEMSTRDALRIDYKRFEPLSKSGSKINHSFGLSSVLLDANDMLSKENFYKTTFEYIQDVEIDFLGIMCMVIKENKPQRELILVGKSDRIVDLTEYFLTNDSAAFLDISLVEDTGDNFNGIQKSIDGFSMRIFQQANPKGSRKQMAPVILSYFSN